MAPRPPRHTGVTTPLHGGFPPKQWRYPATTEGPKAWRWYSCRCHNQQVLAGEHDFKTPRCMDTCFQGIAECPSWSGQCPESCMVGAMGFLLACRLAYLEASEILHTTNTLCVPQHTLSQLLLRQTLVPNSPILISPFHLPLVTSIEMTWDFELWGFSSKEIIIIHNRLQLHDTLNLLPKAFPNLLRLHVIFTEKLLRGIHLDPFDGTNVDQIEEILLQPLLQALKSLAKAKYISIALPGGMFFAARRAAQRSRMDENGVMDERYIQKLRAERKLGLGGLNEWYPFGVDDRDQGRAGEGFWLAYGPESTLIYEQGFP